MGRRICLRKQLERYEMMELYEYPWRLVQNKIVRYPGGREIDRFRGIFPGEDDGRPEAWVGSDTRTVNALEKGDPNDGCAECILPDGTRCYLFEAVEKCPEKALGEEHRRINGDRLGVLVKLLDAQRQLWLQCHPTRAYAKEHFNSDYGKEESWYVIGKRTDCEEPPYVLMGFKEGITLEDFAKGYDAEDVPAMERCCHKIPVEIGDAFSIQAGLPHAIGAGCFVVEVQEPSDITVGVTKLKNATEEEQRAHRERLLNCYIYNGTDYEENLRRYRIPPRKVRSGDWGEENLVIGQGQTEYFSFTRLDLTGKTNLLKTGFLQVAIVLSGKGVMRCGGRELSLNQADELFIPYAAGEIAVEAEPGEPLSLMLCNPAGVKFELEG